MRGISPRRRLIILLRPIIAIVVLGPEIYLRKNEPFSQVFPLVVVILISIFASIILFLILRIGKRGSHFDFSQTVCDTIIVTGLVAFTGGLSSPYTLLFFLNIFEGSLFLSPSGSFTITSIVVAAFIAMGVVWMNRTLSVEEYELTFNIEFVRHFLRIFLFVLFFYLTTAFAVYFRGKFTAGSRALEAVIMTTDDILENINSGIITITREGKIKHCNPAVTQILSLTKSKITNRQFMDIFQGRLQKFSKLIQKFSNSGAERLQERLLIENEEESTIPVMVTISYMRRQNVDFGSILINIVDLTKEEEIQKRLRTTDRMKTALELSAGIAHEIRNPLASIQGALEVITREIKSERKIGKLVELVLKEAGRLNSIIERFLQFVRLPRGEKKNSDLIIILRDVIELIKNHPTYNKEIEIKTDFPQKKYIACVDPEQITQVFVNILLNAFSAVGEKGTVKVSLKERDDYFGILFSDDGVGIDEQELDRIFQPFFSKTQGGSGLGLSVAHRIIERHRGEINVESEKGKGSKFTVWLPKSKA
jgi:two-component system sensor histidine kinase PilS (NtrC family)